jgi:hypothetical protein
MTNMWICGLIRKAKRSKNIPIFFDSADAFDEKYLNFNLTPDLSKNCKKLLILDFR